jgi:hypothetical protein
MHSPTLIVVGLDDVVECHVVVDPANKDADKTKAKCKKRRPVMDKHGEKIFLFFVTDELNQLITN